MPTPTTGQRTPPTPSATAEAAEAAAAARDDDVGEEEGNRAARALASIAAQEEAQARPPPPPPPPPLAVPPPPPPPQASPDNATAMAFLQQLPVAQLQQLAATTTEALSLIQRMLLLGTSPQPTVENSSQRGGTPGSGSAQRSLAQQRRQTTPLPTPSSQPESPSGAAEFHVRCGGCSSVLAVQVPVVSRMWPSMRVECGGCQQVNHVELPAETIRAVEQLYADHQQRLQQQTRAAKQLAALTAHQQQYEEQLRASSLLPTTTAPTPGQDLVASLVPAPTKVHEPKRVPSPYNRFIRDMLKHIKMEHARKKTTIGHNEAFALAANMWGSCELNMRAPNYDPLMANAVFKDDDSVDVVVELNRLRAAKQHQQQEGMPHTPTTAPECEEKNGEKDDAVCAPTTVAPPQPTVPQMGTTGNPWIRPSSARPPQRQPVAGPAATATDPSALLFQPASTSARDELLTTSMIAQRQAQQHCPSVVVQTMAMVAAGMAERQKRKKPMEDDDFPSRRSHEEEEEAASSGDGATEQPLPGSALRLRSVAAAAAAEVDCSDDSKRQRLAVEARPANDDDGRQEEEGVLGAAAPPPKTVQ